MTTEHKNLIYGLDDKPPMGIALFLELQHMIVPVSYTVFAVLVVREIGGLPRQVQTVTTMALGEGNERVLQGLAQASWFSLPRLEYPGWSFKWGLAPAFMVAALAAAVKASGLVTTSQKINDPDWKRADMVTAGRVQFVSRPGSARRMQTRRPAKLP